MTKATGAGPGAAGLSAELGSQPPPSFQELTEDQQAVLVDALRRERDSRASGLGEAAEEALKLVPALARGPVRRILFR
ncbi:hypothetical protein [Streptomyces beihaiensis]|uniref:Uncharacterized protein n=1 Tax=Streptomyces beihaiensis TaxID=2984495 RepID=A0ABT3U2A8_9ACTN|nr:hypothetical protein [Streptomyces beihaiensis]MCX3063452.1 hypothetical protein [Streptomyces beihaiensis]